MNGTCRWCAWCCKLRCQLCCKCQLCCDCCRCPPPPLPTYCPLEPLPPLPCMGPPPPPSRVVREQIVVPIPYPVCNNTPPKPCWYCVPPPRPPSAPFMNCFGPSSSPCDDFYDCGSGEKCCDVHNNDNNCGPFGECRSSRPCTRKLHIKGVGLIPGYKGHVPGLRFHSAGRSFGQATRDTCCIMSKWDECSPVLPCRIWEQ